MFLKRDKLVVNPGGFNILEKIVHNCEKYVYLLS